MCEATRRHEICSHAPRTQPSKPRSIEQDRFCLHSLVATQIQCGAAVRIYFDREFLDPHITLADEDIDPGDEVQFDLEADLTIHLAEDDIDKCPICMEELSTNPEHCFRWLCCANGMHTHCADELVATFPGRGRSCVFCRPLQHVVPK